MATDPHRPDGATLQSSASRRRRALAHLAPIFDLHLYRSRNPSEVDFGRYDLIALIQHAVDVVAMTAGTEGQLGVPRDTVLADLAHIAAKMAPDRPDDEPVHVARHVLDYLLRHGERSTTFAVTRSDPDEGWATVTDHVRVLYETFGDDATQLLINVDTAAVNLLLVATNRSIEDEHEAAIAIMKAQVSSGRLGDAVDSADDALTLSRTYATSVRRMLTEAERDVTRVSYHTDLRPALATAHEHIARRLTTDGALLRHLHGLSADASEEADPAGARTLRQVASRLDRAIRTLAELQNVVVEANPRWRDAQATQAFQATPTSEIDPTADVLTGILTGRPMPDWARHTPPEAGQLLAFTDVVERLTAPRREPPEAEPVRVDDTDLVDTEGIYQQFPEQFHIAADALRRQRIPTGAKARLSDLLTDADQLMAADIELTDTLAGLAGAHDRARRRLRLLLVLDALMLWRPDADPADGWWAQDTGDRTDAGELDIPDLLVHHAADPDLPELP